MMKKFLCAAFMIGAMFAISACSSSDDSGTPSPDPSPTPTPSGLGISDGKAVKPGDMKMSALSGFVFDKAGNALRGVTVTSGTEAVTTDADGGFVLTKVNSVKGRSVVSFSMSGYVDVVRSAPSVDGDVWEIVMVSESESGVTAYVGQEADLATRLAAGGMTVDISESGYKYADTGLPVGSGDYVYARMFYLSPDEDDFAAMMPGGDLAAVRADGSEAELISYGMTKVDLSTYSKKLQLADGKPATLSFPVPDKYKDDTPATIPLWSFNEETGLWEEEGEATYDATTNSYVGTVTHFSWVNLDYPESRATLKVVVKDEAGNVMPNVRVDVDGQRDFFTNVKGEAEGFVPINTDFYVMVHSEDYANYSPEVKKTVSKISTAGATETVELTLPTLAHISGKVVNAGKGNTLATLWIEYAGKSTKKVHNDADGQFFMNAPAGYIGAAKLKMRAADGSLQSYDITLDGKDHAYTVTINTDNTTGGAITVTPAGGASQTIVVSPIYYDDLAGASLIDKTLSYQGNACSVTIEDYSSSKTSYDNVSISVSADGMYPYCETAKATVTVNEYGNVRFQITGEAEVQDWSSGKGELKKVAISADFTVPMLGKGKLLTRFDKSSEFPSFTPWIAGKKATIGLQVTESAKLGKGVLAWFYDDALGYSDYTNLKEQAKKALGEPISEYDGGDGSEGWADMSVAYFYKDGKYVMVSFCPWREGGEDWIMEEMEHGGARHMFGSFNGVLNETHNGRIQVYALEGMTIDYKEFVHEMGK